MQRKVTPADRYGQALMAAVGEASQGRQSCDCILHRGIRARPVHPTGETPAPQTPKVNDAPIMNNYTRGFRDLQAPQTRKADAPTLGKLQRVALSQAVRRHRANNPSEQRGCAPAVNGMKTALN